MSHPSPPPGVAALDHTADVGLEIRAPTLAELFGRAARGMDWLIRGGDPEGGEAVPSGSQRTAFAPGPTPRDEDRVERRLTLSATDLPALFRDWLRELLHWQESEELSFVEARFDTLTETRLDAEVTAARDPNPPIREIKGVTLHGLRAQREDDMWTGRVIFDV